MILSDGAGSDVVFDPGPRRKHRPMRTEDSRRLCKRQRKMSAIGERMVEAMRERGYSALTQRIYERAVRHLEGYYGGRSAEQVSVAEAHRYLRHLKQNEAGASTIGNHTAGIRFLFEVVFGKEWTCVSPLRRRMLEDMDLHGFSSRTQSSYIRAVAELAG